MKPKIAISWSGLPSYGARSVREAVKVFGEGLVVVATRPSVPVEGVEELAGTSVIWLEPNQTIRWEDLNIACPNFFLQSGWQVPAFNRLGNQVRASGGRVGLMADMPWFGSIKQRLRTSVFRWLNRRKFCGIVVPGKGGQDYAKHLGFSEHQIHLGLYSAIPELFDADSPTNSRSKRFTFVGQYIHRKGIDLLLDAFQKIRVLDSNWTLHLYGNGPLKPNEVPGVSVNPFLQADEIASVMQQSKVIVLPSRIDHWGVVVHEAALAGCVLVVSDTTGSRLDFCSELNSIIAKAGDSSSLFKAMHEIISWSDDRFLVAEKESRRMGRAIGPCLFPLAIERMLNTPR